MQSYKFKFLIWQFNMLSDTGKFDKIGVSEVKKHIDSGTISSFIIDQFGADADFSIIEFDDWPILTEEWQNISNAVDEGRKMGIYNRGINLLLAYCLQSFQARELQKAA